MVDRLRLLVWKIFNFAKKKATFYFLSLLNRLVPKSKKSIYFFDRRFRKDNVWALARYMDSNEGFEQYKIYYYTRANIGSFTNVKLISNGWRALLLQLRANYVFYSYRDFPHFRPVRNQVVMDTMHGSFIKKIGYLHSSKFKRLWRFECTFSHILCVSDYFKELAKKSFGASDEQCVVLGYPRNDLIFTEVNALDKLGIDTSNYSKIILWMPTWRTDNTFPIISSRNIQELDDFLGKENILIILKPHPNQVEIDFLNRKYNNIIILWNEALQSVNVEPYHLFVDVDALLTDYSSVFYDFLLTMKPVGFTIDDFEDYSKSYGFAFDDPLSYMPGQKMTNITELYGFLQNIKSGTDYFLEERIRINDLANKYKDGNNCRRVCEFLGLIK